MNNIVNQIKEAITNYQNEINEPSREYDLLELHDMKVKIETFRETLELFGGNNLTDIKKFQLN